MSIFFVEIVSAYMKLDIPVLSYMVYKLGFIFINVLGPSNLILIFVYVVHVIFSMRV